ncbi:MAG: type IX secretion system outer membrane channel protein PorV [Bacteroidales bacterium]|jgi:hypothetical protein|nr:type IX secretion system outer membrane channel protein PorV [Bacteroidales bacterium]
MRKLLVLALCITFFSWNTYAQKGSEVILGQTNNAITTAVPFLLIAPDSRIGGMGETGVAILGDMNAQHWNPAKYLFSENIGGFSLSYSPWLAGLHVRDIYLAYLSGYYKITKMDAVSFSLRFFSMGKMDLTDINGYFIIQAHPYEFAIDAAYSRMLVENLAMSVTGRFIYSNLSTYSSTGDLKPGLSGAADISLFYTKPFRPGKLHKHNLNVGLNISNIGAKVSYSDINIYSDFLPANFRLGIAYDMFFDKYNKLTLAFDVNKLLVTTPPVYLRDTNGFIVMENDIPVVDRGRNPYTTSAAAAVFTSWGDAPGGFREEMNEFILNFGLEYIYNDLLSMRTGYFNEAKTKGARKYITFGVGIKYSVFAIDASYILPVASRSHPLEHTVRFTLSFDFGIPKQAVAAPIPEN